MRAMLAATLLLAPLLAGCLAPQAADVDTQAAIPELDDALAALQAGEPLANIHLLGEWRNGNSAEIAAHGDLLYVMRGGGVTVLNVSDPADVREVAEIRGEHRVLDLKLSHDGRYLFVGDDTQRSGELLGAATGGTGGTWVYDVSDPTAAKLVAHQPIGERRGPHMVFYHQYPDGREIVLGANADISISEFDRDAGTMTPLARYSPDIVFDFNRDPQVVDALYQGWAHDMFAMTEPDGRVFMYVANWDAGLRIVDISDPASPVELGGWNEFPDGHAGNLHTVSTAWVDDRRITVGSVEVGFAVVGGYHYVLGTEPSVMYVWDTTDPADIQLISWWENPMGEKAGRDNVPGEQITSTHNLQFEDGRVYLAHYGLGVFVLDLSTPALWESPEILAYYREEGQNTWDVIVHRGVMLTAGAEGVLALHFAADLVGESGISSRA